MSSVASLLTSTPAVLSSQNGGGGGGGVVVASSIISPSIYLLPCSFQDGTPQTIDVSTAPFVTAFPQTSNVFFEAGDGNGSLVFGWFGMGGLGAIGAIGGVTSVVTAPVTAVVVSGGGSSTFGVAWTGNVGPTTGFIRLTRCFS